MNKNITTNLFHEISQLIETARFHLARYSNSTLLITYWKIGHIVNKDILKNERAEYGEGLVKQLSQQLCKEYGTGFDFPNLTRMIRLAKLYPAEEIIVTVSQQLTWSHFVKLMTIEDPLKRDFYIEMCRLERWNVRNLRKKIDSML